MHRTVPPPSPSPKGRGEPSRRSLPPLPLGAIASSWSNLQSGESLPELIGQLRLPLILLVTYAHSYGAVSTDYDLLTSPFDAYEALKLLVSQTLAKVPVPVFFVISGWLYFSNVKTWNARTYLGKTRRRLLTLLLPYIAANLLMAVKLHLVSVTLTPLVTLPPLSVFWDHVQAAGSQTDIFGRTWWLSAPADMPLWFLRDLMGVSLLTPLIHAASRRLGLLFPAALAVVYLSGVCPFIPGLSAYSVFFFSLGACLAIRKVDVMAAVRRVEWGSYVAFVLLGAAMMCSYRTPQFTPLMLAFRLVSVAVVFNAVRRLLAATSRRLPPTTARAAYVVYLLHYVFFLSFVDDAFFQVFGTSSAALIAHYLLCPLVKAAVILLACRLGQMAYRRLCCPQPPRT